MVTGDLSGRELAIKIFMGVADVSARESSATKDQQRRGRRRGLADTADVNGRVRGVS